MNTKVQSVDADIARASSEIDLLRKNLTIMEAKTASRIEALQDKIVKFKRVRKVYVCEGFVKENSCKGF